AAGVNITGPDRLDRGAVVPTENSISVKKGEVKQLRKAYSSVASSVMASPAAKTATCQLLGLAESCPRRSSARLFQHYIKERQGLRRPAFVAVMEPTNLGQRHDSPHVLRL